MQVLLAFLSMAVVAAICFSAVYFYSGVSRLGLEGWLYMQSARLCAAGDAVAEYKRTVAVYRDESVKLIAMRAKQRRMATEEGA